MMPWWLESVVVGLLLLLSILGASLAGHLLSPHKPLHAFRNVRLAGLVVVAAGEVVLLQAIFFTITRQYSMVFDYLVGRLFGLFCPLLLVQACVSYYGNTHRNLARAGEGVEERQESSRSSSERSCEQGVPSSQQCRSKSGGRFLRHRSSLLSFLSSYLWTFALIMSYVFFLYPAPVHPCWLQCSNNFRTRTIERSLSDQEASRPQQWISKAQMNTHYNFDQAEVREYPRDSPLTDSGDENASPGGNRKGAGDRDATTKTSQADLSGDVQTANTEMNSGRAWEADDSSPDHLVHNMSGMCVNNVGAEVLVYVLFFLPLTLHWLLASSQSPEEAPSAASSDHRADLTEATSEVENELEQKAVTNVPTPGSLPVPHVDSGSQRYIDFDHFTTHATSHDISECSHQGDKVSSEKFSMHHETVSCQTVPQPNITSPDQGLHFPADGDGGCSVCQQLAPSVVMAAAVMLIQSLICPLLWAASPWFSSGQLRVAPAEIMFLPNFCALCFVHRSIVKDRNVQ